MNEKEIKETEVETVEEETEVETVEEETEVEISEIDLLKNQVTELQNDVNKWKTDYYKVFADMENLKRRLKLEHENALKFMTQEMVSDLLPVVDNLERALNVEMSEEIKGYLKGFEMITTQLIEVLRKNGVEAIEAVGKPFDPNYHQAIMMTNDENFESGVVTEELQKGYILKDRVIRASLVKVNE